MSGSTADIFIAFANIECRGACGRAPATPVAGR